MIFKSQSDICVASVIRSSVDHSLFNCMFDDISVYCVLLLSCCTYLPPASEGWEGNILSLFVSSHKGEAPRPGPDGGGGTPASNGVPPGQLRMGERWIPRADMGYPRPGQDGAYPGQGLGTPRDRTADGVLDTPLAVCLLRLRSRTSLYL